MRKYKYLKYIPKDVVSILDVGCGRGEWSCVLKNAGYEVEGCDINPKYISKSKEIIKDIKYADVQELTKYYPRKSFDLVSCFHVIEHVFYPFDALKELSYVTKKYILIAVPNARHIAHDEHDEHLYSWSKKTLKNLLKNFHFKKFIIYEDRFDLFPNWLRKAPITNKILIKILWGPNELVALIKK